MKIDEKIGVLKKPLFVKNEVWAFLLTLGSEPARKISPSAKKYEPAGPYGDPFREKKNNKKHNF